jgi:hypothetical protein
MNAAIYSSLDNARAQTAALAECLDAVASFGRGPIDRDTIRGLSILAGHIAGDISAVQRELESLTDQSRRPGSG